MLWEWIKVAFPPNGYKFTIQSQFATLASKQIMSLIPFSALFYTFFFPPVHNIQEKTQPV